jgi:FkbM family methyltransferase
MIVDSSRLNFYISKFEPTVINTVKRLVKENTLFIDVGAYVGFYTIFCAKHGAKVIALEPDPRSYKILLYNVRLAKVSQKVFALNTAAGDKCGHALLRLSSNPSESSMTSYLKPELVIRKIRCRCVTLDDLINEFGWDKVDLIKIDVEGAGFKVIRGALNSIAKHKPKIILETHKIPSKENELAAVKFLKKNYNYKYKILEYRNKQNFILFLYTDS